jgi:hypothetical protein
MPMAFPPFHQIIITALELQGLFYRGDFYIFHASQLFCRETMPGLW